MILLLRTPSVIIPPRNTPPPLLDLPCHPQTYVFSTTVSARVGFPLCFQRFPSAKYVADTAFVARGGDLMDTTLVGPMARVGGFLGDRLSFVME